MGRPSSAADVLKSRIDILQHAGALDYIINAFVYSDEPLSKELTKETHTILFVKTDHHDGTTWQQHVGIYQDYPMAATSDRKKK